ncbi:unnamed protein product [Prorocentrum cordatum]|uniref:Uncharacterized protein n=1 Tax=Prorocentrum cordatum TaxID=2364126 RepID=A0ABN9VUP7_9DINO|nr:unnamed protein product [Polarella glacialis]
MTKGTGNTYSSSWSKCAACGKCVGNATLESRGRKCCGCGRHVKLYHPKRKNSDNQLQIPDSQKSRGPKPGAGSPNSASMDIKLLTSTLAATTGPLLRHDQAVSAVLKARDNLEHAEARDRAAALELAQADEAWSKAARVLAQHMGVIGSDLQTEKSEPATPNDDLFALTIDEQFFADLGELECDESERTTMRERENQLRST